MKRSVSVCVPLLLGLAGCSPEKAIDPCDHDKFDDKNCGQAVAHGGYYYRGIWRPQTYSQPYSYYEAEARSYAAHGGVPHPAPASEYSPSYSRGVFGSTEMKPRGMAAAKARADMGAVAAKAAAESEARRGFSPACVSIHRAIPGTLLG